MSDEKPEIQLFIKSSTIDREQKGSCPLCQQWFMAACILTEQGILSFHVTIVDAESPPKEFKDLSQSKIFPVVKGIRGLDKRGQDIGDKLADDHERLEEFFESFGCPDLKRDGAVQKHFDDLYKTFNLYLVSGTEQARQRLIHHLEKLNSFLEGEDQIYVIKDSITYGDCYLMPRLHHIKVAAREYGGFEIPEDLFYVWRYLYEAYNTDAFQKTCPTDQDIIKHYEMKTKVFKPKKGVPSLQKSTYSFDIPESILETLENQPPRERDETGDGTVYEDYTAANMMASRQVEDDDGGNVYDDATDDRTASLNAANNSFQDETPEDAIYDDPDMPPPPPSEALDTEPTANGTPARVPSPEPLRSASPEPTQAASPARSASPVEAGSATEPLEALPGPEATYEDPGEYNPANLPPPPPGDEPAVDNEYTIADVEDGIGTPEPDYDPTLADDEGKMPAEDDMPAPDYDRPSTPEPSSTPTPDYDPTPTPTPDYDQTPGDDKTSDDNKTPSKEAEAKKTTPEHDDSVTYENVEISPQSAKSVEFTISDKNEDDDAEEVRVNGTNGSNVTNGHK